VKNQTKKKIDDQHGNTFRHIYIVGV